MAKSTKTPETAAPEALSGSMTQQAPPPPSQAPTKGPSVPYISFVYEKNTNFKNVKEAIPGIQENDVVLVNGPNGPFQKLDELDTFVADGTEFFVARDQNGKILKAKNGPDNPGGPETDGTRQEYEALLVLIVGDTLVPATGSFRAACCRAPIGVVNAVIESVNDPGAFAASSAGHKAALSIPIPFARVYGSIRIFNEKNKRSNGSHRAADATVLPTTAKVRSLIEAADADPAFNQKFKEAQANFARRVDDIRKEVK